MKTKAVHQIKSEKKIHTVWLFGYSAIISVLFSLIQEWLASCGKAQGYLSGPIRRAEWTEASILSVYTATLQTPDNTEYHYGTTPHLGMTLQLQDSERQISRLLKWLPACLCFVSSSPVWLECFHDRFSLIHSRGFCAWETLSSQLSRTEPHGRVHRAVLLLVMPVICTWCTWSSYINLPPNVVVWNKLVNSKQCDCLCLLTNESLLVLHYAV